MKKTRKKRFLKLIIIFLLVSLAVGYYSYSQGYLDKIISENKVLNGIVERKKLKAYDLYSDERVYAVMIDNIKSAWPQTGLGDAFLIYEIIVEGGQTRLMALFKDQDTIKIGPIRSLRHYYIDYALESDAIVVHFGGSPTAYSDLNKYSIEDLDGIGNASGVAYRDKLRRAPHNVYSSIESFKEYALKRGHEKASNKKPLLNYSFNTIDLKEAANAKVANNMILKYSNFHTTKYTYLAEEKLYSRNMNNIDHKDAVTGELYKFKNVIVVRVKSDALIDNTSKGRQELYTVGSGDGYYMTGGYAIPITWEKSTRFSKTIFKNLAGEEIKVNDGKTFIQIQPKVQQTVIS